jgi:hypothetical protein
MTELLWLSGAAVALMIWTYRYRPLPGHDLGTVSAAWLHEYRCETHPDG